MLFPSCPNCTARIENTTTCKPCGYNLGYTKPIIRYMDTPKEDKLKSKASAFLFGVPNSSVRVLVGSSQGKLSIASLVRPKDIEIQFTPSEAGLGRITVPFKTPYCLIYGNFVSGKLEGAGIRIVSGDVRDEQGVLKQTRNMKFMPLPIGNVDASGRICWGTANTVPGTLKEAFGQFFSSPFNYHWTVFRTMKSWVPIGKPKIKPDQNASNTVIEKDGVKVCTVCKTCRCHECPCFVSSRGVLNDLAHMWMLAAYRGAPGVRSGTTADFIPLVLNEEITCLADAIFMSENRLLVEYGGNSLPHPTDPYTRTFCVGAATFQSDGSWLVRMHNGRMLSYNPTEDSYRLLGKKRVKRKLIKKLDRLRLPTTKV